MFLRLVKAIASKQNPNLQMDHLVTEPFSSTQLLLQNIGFTKLLGTKDADKVEISQKSLEILKKSNSAINRDNTLKELNQEFQYKTYLISNYLTVADLVMYSFLYSSVPLASGDRIVYCNVMRYLDLIQHQVAEMIPQPTKDIEILEFNLEIPFLPSQPVVAEKKPDGKEMNKKSKSDSSAKEPEKEVLNPTKLDIRVGRILAVERHPEADSLFVETIDIGEEKPRTVVSGLVKFMKESDLINKNVCLLCNLKPAKMRGIESAAMVLCANSADGTLVEVLEPPSDSNPGDKLVFDGFTGTPETLLKPKQKIWESLQPNLFTDGTLQATFVCPDTKKEHVLKSSRTGQPVTSKSLKKATIK